MSSASTVTRRRRAPQQQQLQQHLPHAPRRLQVGSENGWLMEQVPKHMNQLVHAFLLVSSFGWTGGLRLEKEASTVHLLSFRCRIAP